MSERRIEGRQYTGMEPGQTMTVMVVPAREGGGVMITVEDAQGKARIHLEYEDTQRLRSALGAVYGLPIVAAERDEAVEPTEGEETP